MHTRDVRELLLTKKESKGIQRPVIIQSVRPLRLASSLFKTEQSLGHQF